MTSKRRLFFILAVFLGLVLLSGIGAGAAATRAWRQFNQSTPLEQALAPAVRAWRFDLLRYEIGAVSGKVGDLFRRPGVRLNEDEQRRLVEQYQQRALTIRRLQDEVERRYADPAAVDPAAITADARAQIDHLNDLQSQLRPLVEGILQQQTTQVIGEMGLTTAGLVWPPVRFDFSALPNYLIVSPRDRIEVEAGIYLHADLDLPQIEALENDIASEFGKSTLIEGLGGLGVWPTLVLDQAGLGWIAETIAHEWVHNYLVFYPLGRRLNDSGQMNTINETVATIVGEEIGQKVAHDFYGIPYPPPPAIADQPPPPPDPDRFDFDAEMRRTRLHVDELLAAGKIEEAETYMEARRQIFVQNGYPLRKLNQAYFAFHGSYATGAASTDPIGPKLQELRRLTPDLSVFVAAVREIAQPSDLDRLLNEWGG
ncbi:MAG: hypothetical protein K1X65_13040 [Caldilineales bacterium]|nr:hypothetical protein [Caldilineales bacterium]